MKVPRCGTGTWGTRLLVVNEPETSLHPDILDALAHLIVRAAKNTQLWITTHSQPLADRIENFLSRRGFCAEKHSGVSEKRLNTKIPCRVGAAFWGGP